MKLRAFSIKDVKAHCFLHPFFSRSVVDCKRYITASFDDPAILKTPIGMNPGDFELYEVAIFDDEKGEFTPFPPIFVCQISVLLPKSMISTVDP